MNKDIIYLSGASKNISSVDSNTWRNEAMNQLAWSDRYVGYNPNNYFNYTDKQPESVKQCMNTFLYYLRKSKIVLVNLDWSDSSIGTGMELMLAYELHIPIIGFTTGHNIYDWCNELCDYVVCGSNEIECLTQAIAYINKNYNI